MTRDTIEGWTLSGHVSSNTALDKYAELFAEHSIGLDVLADLTDADE